MCPRIATSSTVSCALRRGLGSAALSDCFQHVAQHVFCEPFCTDSRNQRAHPTLRRVDLGHLPAVASVKHPLQVSLNISADSCSVASKSSSQRVQQRPRSSWNSSGSPKPKGALNQRVSSSLHDLQVVTESVDDSLSPRETLQPVHRQGWDGCFEG